MSRIKDSDIRVNTHHLEKGALIDKIDSARHDLLMGAWGFLAGVSLVADGVSLVARGMAQAVGIVYDVTKPGLAPSQKCHCLPLSDQTKHKRDHRHLDPIYKYTYILFEEP